MIINKIYNNSSGSRVNLVVDNSITLLILSQKFYIKDILTLFLYYDNVKEDITRLSLYYSHQYLSNYCIDKYPDGINIVGLNAYSYVILNLNLKMLLSKLIKNGSFKY